MREEMKRKSCEQILREKKGYKREEWTKTRQCKFFVTEFAGI